MKKSNPRSLVRGGFQGYLFGSYADVLAEFGEHLGPSPDGKVRAEWVLDTPVGSLTIYDYKAVESLESVRDWHVGGHSKAVLAWLARRVDGGPFIVRDSHPGLKKVLATPVVCSLLKFIEGRKKCL